MAQKYKKEITKPRKKKKRFRRYIKKGFCKKTGKQIWYDKIEKRHFFKEYKRRGYSERRKKKAIELHGENVGFRAIGRMLHISHTTAYYWVRAYQERLQDPTLPAWSSEIQLDEMWHFNKKKAKRDGYGLQPTKTREKSSPSS